jgi:hypothetical protein
LHQLPQAGVGSLRRADRLAETRVHEVSRLYAQLRGERRSGPDTNRREHDDRAAHPGMAHDAAAVLFVDRAGICERR